MLIWSWDKDWRSKMAKSRLPASVTIGIKVPWVDTKACKICMAEAETISGLVTHLRKTHRPRKIVFVCGKCAGTYNTLLQATSHFPKCVIPQKNKAAAGENRCDLCSRSFSRKSGLTIHVKSKHSGAYFTEVQMSEVAGSLCGQQTRWITSGNS